LFFINLTGSHGGTDREAKSQVVDGEPVVR